MPTLHRPTLRPRSETKTGRVWVLADQITRQKGSRASRGEVMEAFLREGGNPNTASTQYSHWRADFDRRSEPNHFRPDASADHPATTKMTLTIGPDGRLLIPFELRSKMGLDSGGRVSVSVDNGELRVVAPRVALRRLQQLVREMDQGEGSVVDELINDRRAESQ